MKNHLGFLHFLLKPINQSINLSGQLILYRFFHLPTTSQCALWQRWLRTNKLYGSPGINPSWFQTPDERLWKQESMEIHILKIPLVCKVSWCWSWSSSNLHHVGRYCTLNFQIPTSYVLESHTLLLRKIWPVLAIVTLSKPQTSSLTVRAWPSQSSLVWNLSWKIFNA